MSPSALILIADGTEEMEFTIAYDVLVRGGINVQSAYVGSSAHSSDSNDPHSDAYVTCSRGVKIVPDVRLPELAGGKALAEYDAIVVPGGVKGAEILSSNEDVIKLLAAFAAKGKLVACICAGSLAAKAAQIGTDNAITSHPSVKSDLEKDYHYKEERVVVAGKLITSRGPGTAIEFALAIVEALVGKEKSEEIAGPMILHPSQLSQQQQQQELVEKLGGSGNGESGDNNNSKGQ